MKKLILILVVTGCMANASLCRQKPAVFAMDAKALENNKARIKAKDAAIMPAFHQLIKDADKALQFGPVSVMEKKNNPPSGDKHDYMSIAPYYWPDPSKPDGIPYIRKDGQTTPEVKEYKDKEYMPKLCEAVHVLSLTYYFSEENVYAEHAAKLLRVWFLDTATRMNPNLNFGQAIKGITTGRGAGMIDTRHFLKVIDAVGLLKTSKYMKEKEVNGMKKWYREFLHWMQTSPVGMDEMAAENNHGAWYDAQRLSFALFIDSIDLAKKIIMNARDRLDKQMDDSARFPKEMERTISLHYTTFVLSAFFYIAQMAESIGIDLWSAVTPSGKSLKKGFNELHPYLTREKEWEGPQIKPFEYEEGYQLLADAGQHWSCRNCMQQIAKLAGDKHSRLRINLFY